MISIKSLVSQKRALAILAGCAAVAIWTLLRHITNGVNFDVVGQIGLAQQWSDGWHGNVVLGRTNYLFKMPFYMAVNHLHFLSPMNRLLLLALVFNLATFLVIFRLTEKLLDSRGITNRDWFYLSMVWLATIFGSVFWVDYANSRNLEVAGGVFLIYLTIKYLEAVSLKRALAIFLVASLIFFADPLQFYVCGLGCLVYVALVWFKTKTAFRRPAGLVAAVLAGYACAKLLSLLSERLLGVSYLALPARPFTSNDFIKSLEGAAVGFIRIFDADFLKRPYSPNNLRELLNLAVLILIVYLLIKIFRRRKDLYFSGLLPVLIVTNLAVFIASGQASQAGTERYLIMIPVVTAMFFSVNSSNLKFKTEAIVKRLWAGVIIVSGLLLLGAVAHSWPIRHSKDAHIYAITEFLSQNNYRLAFGTLDQGVTATYFAEDKYVVLPVDCKAGHLKALGLFYDKGEFKRLKSYSGEYAFILPSEQAQAAPNGCSQGYMTSTFGAPLRQQFVAGVGEAFIYNRPPQVATD